MGKHFRYLSYVLRHKWFVFVAGLRVGAPLWRLLIHDWSKFTLAEWGPYVRNFYGPPQPPPRDPTFTSTVSERQRWVQWKQQRQEAVDRAWLHHQHWNAHHWQHWVLREDSGALKLLEMPERFAREMVADWMGAGRAITGKWEAAAWYAKNRDVIVLHPETRRFVERLFAAYLPDSAVTLASPTEANG